MAECTCEPRDCFERQYIDDGRHFRGCPQHRAEFWQYNVRYTTLEDLRSRPDLQPTVCKDCGVATEPGKGSARCPACWEDRCGSYE